MVIIVGAARSGTKYLRDILATAPNAAKVPYDINYIWRYGHEDHPSDVFPASFATPKVAGFIRKQVTRLSGASPSGDRVILEKTVGSSLRVPFCDAVFPDALFVHLVRDGRAVTESAMRQWQAPPDWKRLIEKFRGIPLQNIGYAAWFFANYARGLVSGRGGGSVWGPRYPGIGADVAADKPLAEICARQWAASVETASTDLAALPDDRTITIRYEDLVTGDAALRRVAAFCGLADIDAIAARHAERVDRSTDEKWRGSMSAAEKTAMLAAIDPLLRQLGYGDKEPTS